MRDHQGLVLGEVVAAEGVARVAGRPPEVAVRHSPELFGLTEDGLRERFAPYVDRFLR